MNCNEFEIFGLDAERDSSLSDELRNQALEHLQLCASCAALKDSWESAKTELITLRDFTEGHESPARVKLRVLQEFRTKHHSVQVRRRTKFAAWALAAAAILLCAVITWNWRTSQRDTNVHLASQGGPGTQNMTSTAPRNQTGRAASAQTATLVADNDGDFTILPGTIWQETDDGTIVRVAMQRAELSALGFPVNEERAAEYVQVDLLLASDGSPQALRVPQ